MRRATAAEFSRPPTTTTVLTRRQVRNILLLQRRELNAKQQCDIRTTAIHGVSLLSLSCSLLISSVLKRRPVLRLRFQLLPDALYPPPTLTQPFTASRHLFAALQLKQYTFLSSRSEFRTCVISSKCQPTLRLSTTIWHIVPPPFSPRLRSPRTLTTPNFLTTSRSIVV